MNSDSRRLEVSAPGRCGIIGTVGYGLYNELSVGTHTTPDPLTIQQALFNMHRKGARCVVAEVSSHAMDQARVRGVDFDIAVLTNLTRDHLDYHGSMQRYFEAKAQLFLRYPARYRIVNLDSEFGTELASRCGQDVVTVSTRFDRVSNGRPFVFVRSVVADGTGYGEDGAVWGGEVFHNDERVGHLENQLQVGGDSAAQYPAKMLFNMLRSRPF